MHVMPVLTFWAMMRRYSDADMVWATVIFWILYRICHKERGDVLRKRRSRDETSKRGGGEGGDGEEETRESSDIKMWAYGEEDQREKKLERGAYCKGGGKRGG